MNTEFKGTLGVWTTKYNGHYWEVLTETDAEMKNVNNFSIFKHTLDDRQNYEPVNDEEIQANAQLIANAPELLEACVKLQEWHKKYPTGKIYNHSTSLVLERELTEIVDLQAKAIQKALNP